MRRFEVLSLALVAALSVGCSREHSKALDKGTEPSSEPKTVGTTGPDIANQDARDFIHYVAIANMAEMDLGKLAAERGRADEVKKFARMMIAEHTASGEKLKALAAELKIQPPGELDEKHAEQRDKLGKQQGADFDRDYASTMVEAHKELIDQLEPRIDKKALAEWKAGALPPDRSDNPTTMRINQFAADIYPAVHAHLEAAKALESSLKKRYTTP